VKTRAKIDQNRIDLGSISLWSPPLKSSKFARAFQAFAVKTRAKIDQNRIDLGSISLWSPPLKSSKFARAFQAFTVKTRAKIYKRGIDLGSISLRTPPQKSSKFDPLGGPCSLPPACLHAKAPDRFTFDLYLHSTPP
jgi:hypothetical protein